jgi:murein DD-endopeptidase MepM/ murein hydrolase activator NlpD
MVNKKRLKQFTLFGLILISTGLIFAPMIFNRIWALIEGHKQKSSDVKPSKPVTYSVDFRQPASYQILPRYLDLNVGDKIDVIRSDSKQTHLRILGVKVLTNNLRMPRTRVTLEANGETFFVDCGMQSRKKSGIGPVTPNNLKIAVEITQKVFSRIKNGKSLFNNYKNFQLTKDLRLAIWEADQPILRTIQGVFVVQQPEWTRDEFGNWLHETSYGLHSAIDIYATKNGIAEKVRSPVDGFVPRVFRKDAPNDSTTQIKVIHLLSQASVGPRDEKIFFRFMHLSEIFVSPGEYVRKGQVIGLTGHTGFAKRIGDHLHFEMRIDGSVLGLDPSKDMYSTIPINPYNYLLDWWSES